MSIRVKLFLAFSIVLTLAVGVAAYGVRAISDAENLVVQLYDRPFMALSHARAAQAKFSEARTAMDRRSLSRDAARESNDVNFKAAMNDVIEDLTIVRERMTQTGHAQRALDVQVLVRDWYRMGLEIIKPQADGRSEEPLPTNVMSQGDIIAAAIDRIVEDASEYGFEFRSQAKAKVSASQSTLTTLAIATVLAGVLFSLGIAYSFGRAIRNAMAISERIAAGNLSQKISTSRRDELGRLLVSLGQMQESLRNKVDAQHLAAELKDRDNANQIARRQRIEQQIADFRGSIGKTVNQTGEMTERMNSTARKLSVISTEADSRSKDAAAGAKETSGNVVSVAASTEQLDTSIREISIRLASATDVVNGATETARNTKDLILRLAESAERINGVVDLIRSIAEQTNLLALNATIEAARAGNAGRGFAVVASEVKSLATQTAKATLDISDQISEVQLSSTEAVERIKSIVSVMTEIHVVTTEIAAAVLQQGSATEEIARRVQSVASATQNVARNVAGTTTSIGDTSYAAAEVLEAAEYMTTHTDELRASVDQFLREVAAA
jgi:methyl-accepting chemotaxis protein